jgi:hypothetical protein
MTGVSTLGQALAQIARIKDQQTQFASLNTQLATGKKTQVFSGLQTDTLTSQRARANFKATDTYINNITNADRRISLMLKAIEEFKAQAENFANALTGFSQESVHQNGEVIYYDDPTTPNVQENTQIGMSEAEPDIDLRTLQELAGNIYNFMVNLLNSRENDRYLLGGADTLTKPLTDNGTLDATMNSFIADWKAGTVTTGDFLADLKNRDAASNPQALTDSIIGYSAPLTAGNVQGVFVRVDGVSEIEYTALANEKPFRDVLVALSYFKNENLPPVADQVEIDPGTGLPVILTQGAPGADMDEMKENFYAVFNDLTKTVNRALDDIDQVRFRLENARARITELKQSHQEQKSLLLGTISNVEDVDINEVALKLNMLQIQLDASYRVTARVSQLSLVNFI